MPNSGSLGHLMPADTSRGLATDRSIRRVARTLRPARGAWEITLPGFTSSVASVRTANVRPARSRSDVAANLVSPTTSGIVTFCSVDADGVAGSGDGGRDVGGDGVSAPGVSSGAVRTGDSEIDVSGGSPCLHATANTNTRTAALRNRFIGPGLSAIHGAPRSAVRARISRGPVGAKRAICA